MRYKEHLEVLETVLPNLLRDRSASKRSTRPSCYRRALGCPAAAFPETEVFRGPSPAPRLFEHLVERHDWHPEP